MSIAALAVLLMVSRSSNLFVSMSGSSVVSGIIVMGAAAVSSQRDTHLIVMLLSPNVALPLPGLRMTFAVVIKGIPNITSYELIGRSRKSHDTHFPIPISISSFAE